MQTKVTVSGTLKHADGLVFPQGALEKALQDHLLNFAFTANTDGVEYECTFWFDQIKVELTDRQGHRSATVAR